MACPLSLFDQTELKAWRLDGRRGGETHLSTMIQWSAYLLFPSHFPAHGDFRPQWGWGGCIKFLALDNSIFSATAPSGFSGRPRAGNWNCSTGGSLQVNFTWIHNSWKHLEKSHSGPYFCQKHTFLSDFFKNTHRHSKPLFNSLLKHFLS